MHKITFIIIASLVPLVTACAPQGEKNSEKVHSNALDNLICNFTEPFFTLELDSTSGTVFYSSVDTYDDKTGKSEKREFAKNARITLVAPDAASRLGTKLVLKDGDSKTLLDLTVDFKGSDGMSDNVYPVTALQQGKYGPHQTGCTTTTFSLLAEDAKPSDADARRLIERLVSR